MYRNYSRDISLHRVGLCLPLSEELPGCRPFDLSWVPRVQTTTNEPWVADRRDGGNRRSVRDQILLKMQVNENELKVARLDK